MQKPFFEKPILNSPYAYPQRHWELDEQGQPTQRIIDNRRKAEFISPIPRPRRQKGPGRQASLVLDQGLGLSTEEQQYNITALINGVRAEVDRWRGIPTPPADWRVTPETARLLQHWRHHAFSSIRPFFCQIEAVETAIWLTEVAPQMGKSAQTYIDQRHPSSKKFTRGFLIVAPGITIKDRLRVLQPNDPDSYYASRELVPGDMLADLERARIVITNYHAFKPRERLELSKGGRRLLQGQGGEALNTLETEGQMLQRVMPELMGLKNIIAINDEAHHCYREKPGATDDDLKGDEKKEAEENSAAARLWISGLEAVQRKLGLARVFDLSATPFFLSGSGYAEGTLFPWTMSDFSLMDAIECGIVKLPRVPVADNIPGGEMPMFRNLWEHIRSQMPKPGCGKGAERDAHQALHPGYLPIHGHLLGARRQQPRQLRPLGFRRVYGCLADAGRFCPSDCVIL
nr:DEAD/DEAH box helicase family protein [Acidithiobacillus ferrooxidans]